MKDETVYRMFRVGGITLSLLLVSGSWYYFYGRHPRVVLSQPLTEKREIPACLHVAPNEVFLVSGQNARLVDTGSGKQKWAANLASATATAPASATPAPTAALPAATPDPRVAKLTAWRDDLTRRRAALKTPQEIKAFNDEAAKYHAELTAFRGQTEPAAATPAKPAANTSSKWEHEIAQKRQVRNNALVSEKTAQLTQLKAGAKSDFQHQMVKEESARVEAVQAVLHAQPALDERSVIAGESSEEAEEDERFADSDPNHAQLAAVQDALWIIRGREATALDRTQGKTLRKLTLPGEAQHTWSGPSTLYILVQSGNAQQILRLPPGNAPWQAAPVAVPWRAARNSAAGAVVRERSTSFSLAGDSLLQVDSHLLEKKVMDRKAMHGSSTEDWEKADREGHGGWAGDAALIAQAMANDAKREETGGVERVDLSTYEVSITHPFEPGPPVWTAKVNGAPELFSLATLDLLVCGTRVIALDRKGVQVWEAKLAWELFGDAAPPCLECGDQVYLYDRAFLMALQRQTGKVLWRLPSVGIQKVSAGSSSALFVCTQNAPADSARFSQESHLDKQACSILKVDARTGKILWNAPKFEDCFVAGGAVYAAREIRNGSDAVEQAFTRSAPTTRYLLFKLSTFSGQPQWQWLQMRRPLQIEPEGRTVSLLFGDEFQSLKSFAL